MILSEVVQMVDDLERPDGQWGLIPIERIATQIYLLRGQKVILDFDLAMLYGVPTRALNQAVTRNRERFPKDFMFQLSKEEFEHLRSQIVISS